MRRAASRRPAARRAASACGALALTLLLSACDFIGLDMFPPELMNVEADVDLAEIVANAGATLGRVRRIESLTSSASGKAFVFAMVETSAGPLLMILDGADLAFEKLVSGNALNPALGVDMDGNFQCGKVNVESSYLIDSGTTYGPNDGYHRLFPGLSGNLVFHSNNTNMITLEKFATWSTAASPTSAKQPFSTLSTPITLLDAERFADGSAALLFTDSYSYSTTYAMRFSDTNAVETAFSSSYLEDGDLDATTIAYGVHDEGAWVTKDGVILLRDDYDRRLIRFEYGSGAEIDSKTIKTEWKEAVSFDPSGDFWFYYDSLSGRLYKMRTWWK